LSDESPETLSLDRLLQAPRYRLVLTYPRFEPAGAAQRLRELRRLGVTHLEFAGRRDLSGVRILGKGHVGVIVIAHTRSGKAALKIRRLDADRKSLRPEARMLGAANAAGIGPRLHVSSTNFLLMELIEGNLLPDWARALGGRNARPLLRETLTRLIEDCFRLDQAGIDHGELSQASRHVIVEPSGRPRIVDFESASRRRRPSNVTSICQFLFIGSKTARDIVKLLSGLDKKELIDALREYKASLSLEALHGIERAAGLRPA